MVGKAPGCIQRGQCHGCEPMEALSWACYRARSIHLHPPDLIRNCETCAQCARPWSPLCLLCITHPLPVQDRGGPTAGYKLESREQMQPNPHVCSHLWKHDLGLADIREVSTNLLPDLIPNPEAQQQCALPCGPLSCTFFVSTRPLLTRQQGNSGRCARPWKGSVL